MKIFKLLSRLFVAFGFVLMFAVSGWASGYTTILSSHYHAHLTL